MLSLFLYNIFLYILLLILSIAPNYILTLEPVEDTFNIFPNYYNLKLKEVSECLDELLDSNLGYIKILYSISNIYRNINANGNDTAIVVIVICMVAAGAYAAYMFFKKKMKLQRSAVEKIG